MSKATLRVSLAAEPGLRPARPHGKPTANKHSSSPNSSILFRSRVPRCNASCMADARCYAARYPDLRSLCAGGSPCRFAELLNHFQQHGRKENRTYHCFYTVRPVPPRCKPGPKQIEEQTTPVDTVSSDSFLSPASTCILLTMCYRVENLTRYTSRGRVLEAVPVSVVYRDRVSRWATSGLSTFAVDSCNGSLTVPGVTVIQHLQTKRLKLNYPSGRERDALLYALPRLPAACSFVFKVTAKYYPPDFAAHVLPRVPSDAAVVLQKSKAYGQGCEIFGAPREALITQLGEEEWEVCCTPGSDC